MRGLSSRACRISRGHFKSCTCNASDSRVSRNSRPAMHHAAPDGTGGFRGKREGAPCGAPSRCASGYGSAPCGRDALSSHGLNRSTFGDEGLNCRVRDGFGWDPLSMVAPAGGGPHAEGIPLSSAPWGPHGAPSRGLRKIRSVSRSSVIR